MLLARTGGEGGGGLDMDDSIFKYQVTVLPASLRVQEEGLKVVVDDVTWPERWGSRRTKCCWPGGGGPGK